MRPILNGSWLLERHLQNVFWNIQSHNILRCLGYVDKPTCGQHIIPDGNGGAPEWQVGTKRNAFIEALRIGNVGNRRWYNPDVNYARGTYAQYLPVDPSYRTLQDPITCGLLCPTTQQAQADFRFGDSFSWS